MLAVNGAYKTQEVFAVDYIRMVNGRIYTGNGTRNADWFGYGQGVFAAAPGRVVSAVDDRPGVPPSSRTIRRSPTTRAEPASPLGPLQRLALWRERKMLAVERAPVQNG
jgi:hypothetical protein